jgi:hypothetical protein
MITRAPHSDLYVELEYTRDRKIDLPNGGWQCVPEEPAGAGWFLWDIIPERKSGWIRIWSKRGRPFNVHADGGSA